jgi:serine/threonine protein phosphatase PrpC
MEDFVLVQNYQKYCIAAIFDGHGGEECSKMLFQSFVPIFQRNLKKVKRISTSLQLTVKQLNTYACFYFNFKCGSTANVAVINKLNGRWYIANLGDSRAVICGFPRALFSRTAPEPRVLSATVDHKPENEVKRIEQQGGFVEQDPGGTWRVNGILAMSRAVGDKHLCKYLSDHADVYQGSLKGRNTCSFIVLGSDGLFDVMTNDEVCDFVNALLTMRFHRSEIARLLVRYAIEVKGSYDNTSAVILYICND